MKYKGFQFLWYDFWVGLFYDQKKRILYFCPLPCCVFKFEAVEHQMHQTRLTATQKEAFDKTVKDYIDGDVKESPRW